MPNGIYLTLEQYKDKDLPITITINGHTYHSQYALATAQNTYFEMGKQHGMELGSDNTYSDKEMSRMHNQWYNEGYEAGYEQGKQAGITNKELPGEWVLYVEQAYKEGYAEGKEEATFEKVDQFNKGYEIGKKANGYTVDDIKQLHTDNEFTRKIWYDKGKAEGYEEGYNDAKGEDDYCKDCKEEPGKDEQNAKEIPGEYLAHIEEARLEGYADGFNDGKEQGFEEGFMNLKLILKK